MATSFPMSDAPQLAPSTSSLATSKQKTGESSDNKSKSTTKMKKKITFDFGTPMNLGNNQSRYVNFNSIDLESENSAASSTNFNYANSKPATKTHPIQSRGLDLDYGSWLPSILFTLLALVLIFGFTYLLSLYLPEDFFVNSAPDVDAELEEGEEDLGDPMDMSR